MLAIDYINSNFICGLVTDTELELKKKFTEQKVSHLPIIDRDGIFIGSILEDDSSGWPVDLEQRLSKDLYSNAFQHIYECLEILVANKLTCLAVVDSNRKINGVITLLEIAELSAQMAVTSVPGAVLVIEVPARDFTLVQIAQIIEFNGAKLIALHTEHSIEKNTVRLILKINTRETSSIMQSFRRYDFNVISHYIGTDTMEKFYHNRIDELLRFINI